MWHCLLASCCRWLLQSHATVPPPENLKYNPNLCYNYLLDAWVARKFQMRPEPGLAFILQIIAILTKEPDTLQADAPCKHTIQQNATAAGLHRIPRWGSLQHSPIWFYGGSGRRTERGKRERKGKKREDRGREERGRKERTIIHHTHHHKIKII